MAEMTAVVEDVTIAVLVRENELHSFGVVSSVKESQ